MGFEICEVGFGKKMNWEMGLVSPLHYPLTYILLYFLFILLSKFKHANLQ